MELQEKINLVVECERLFSFLENNQLVQANAVAQKLEGLTFTSLCKEVSSPDKTESHPLWKPYKAVIRCKRYILSGSTKDALKEIEGLAVMLRQ